MCFSHENTNKYSRLHTINCGSFSSNYKSYSNWSYTHAPQYSSHTYHKKQVQCDCELLFTLHLGGCVTYSCIFLIFSLVVCIT